MCSRWLGLHGTISQNVATCITTAATVSGSTKKKLFRRTEHEDKERKVLVILKEHVSEIRTPFP
jgi:hypothetical protein